MCLLSHGSHAPYPCQVAEADTCERDAAAALEDAANALTTACQRLGAASPKLFARHDSGASSCDSPSQTRGVEPEVLLQAAKALLLSLLPYRVRGSGAQRLGAFGSYAAMAAAVPKGNWFGAVDDAAASDTSSGGAAAAPGGRKPALTQCVVA